MIDPRQPFNFLRFMDLLVILGDKSQRLTVMYNDDEMHPETMEPEEVAELMSKYVIDLQAILYDDGQIGIGITLVDTVEVTIMPSFGNPTSEE